MIPSEKIITLAVVCFGGLFALAGVVLWEGNSTSSQLLRAVSPSDIESTDDHLFISEKNDIEKKIFSAEAFLVVLVQKDGTEKILTDKNKNRLLPIASISKLVTALVAREQYRAEETVTISETALQGRASSTVYHVGDRFLFSDILYPLLLASHNEIANVLAEKAGTERFVDTMNQKAQELGLRDTFFVNVSGLDTATSTDKINISTASDVIELVRYIGRNNPDILAVTGQKEFELSDVNKKFVAKIVNTNRLVSQGNLPFHIIAGKTGETPRAKQNLVIVAEAPCAGTLFAVLLGSKDRFFDMEEMLDTAFHLNDWSCGV